MTYTDKAIEALERSLSRKVWREDGWEVPAIDVQEALDALKAEQAIMCEVCRWEAGFGARKPVGEHTHPVDYEWGAQDTEGRVHIGSEDFARRSVAGSALPDLVKVVRRTKGMFGDWEEVEG